MYLRGKEGTHVVLQRAVSELDDTERHKLKKKAIKVSKFDADKRDLLQVSYNTNFAATPER